MYCSIDEAWNCNNSMDDISRQITTNFTTPFAMTPDIRENFEVQQVEPQQVEPQQVEYQQVESPMESQVESQQVDKSECNKEECELVVEKVLSCPKCRKLIEERLKTKINIRQIAKRFMTSEMKDVIIMLLFAIIIVILIDLLSKVKKNN